MEKQQSIAILLIVVGVFGLQIGLYELVTGMTPWSVTIAMGTIGSVLAYKGVDIYRKIEDEE